MSTRDEAKHRASNLARERETRSHTNALKRERGCADCGTHEGRLEWHHRDPTTKSFTVGQMGTRALATVLAEIAKCDVLCPRCHHHRHLALDPMLRVRAGRAGGAAGKGKRRPWQTPEWYAARRRFT